MFCVLQVTCITYLPNDPCFAQVRYCVCCFSQQLVLPWLMTLDSLAQGAEDLAVRVWDPRSGALRVVQEFKGYTYFPVGCARVLRALIIVD